MDRTTTTCGGGLPDSSLEAHGPEEAPGLAALLHGFLGVFTLFLFVFSLTGNVYAESHTPERVHTYGPYGGTATASGLAEAIEIPASAIVSTSLGTSDPQGGFVFTSALAGFPVAGASFAAISSGHAANASLPNNEPNLSTEQGGLKNAQGNDLFQLTVTLNVPPGARFWAVDWKFLSEEFPEFVGSPFNDAFFIETPNSNITITGDIASSSSNVAFDPFGSKVSINTTGATGMTAANADGTTYDGATAILTTATRIPDGATQVTIVFSVTDLGDSVFDTTVFLDNFRFVTEFPAPPPLDAPGAKMLIPEGPVVIGLPTVVLTHGLSAKF